MFAFLWTAELKISTMIRELLYLFTPKRMPLSSHIFCLPRVCRVLCHHLFCPDREGLCGALLPAQEIIEHIYGELVLVSGNTTSFLHWCR